MRSALHCLLLFSALWTLSLCGTREFYTVKPDMTWTEAQKLCRVNFTDLATIECENEMNAIKDALKGIVGEFWIGLNKKVQLGQITSSWVWSDGSSSTYRSWGPWQPDNDFSSENCVSIRSDMGFNWNDLYCGWTKNAICYRELPVILINEKKTWREALKYCRENHVDLVSVHTKKIQRWVETALICASTEDVWIGLRHTCTLGFWFWVIGESICYQNWAPGNGMGEEDCSNGERTGAVQSGTMKWVSLPETQTLSFICTTV